MGIEILGKDISLKDNQIQFSLSQDFLAVDGMDNLKQAIITRLQTVLGEYFVAGYGSELHKTIGSKRDNLLRGEILGYVSGALYQEPRISRIKDIIIEFPNKIKEDINTVKINITIIPVGTNVPLNLIFPYFLE